MSDRKRQREDSPPQGKSSQLPRRVQQRPYQGQLHPNQVQQQQVQAPHRQLPPFGAAQPEVNRVGIVLNEAVKIGVISPEQAAERRRWVVEHPEHQLRLIVEMMQILQHSRNPSSLPTAPHRGYIQMTEPYLEGLASRIQQDVQQQGRAQVAQQQFQPSQARRMTPTQQQSAAQLQTPAQWWTPAQQQSAAQQ